MILVVLVVFNYMNNEARGARRPVMGTNNTPTTTTTTDDDRETSRNADGKAEVFEIQARPRLLKVRDGSVAETLPSFAFNPDPHLADAWSILHLPPIFAVRRGALFLRFSTWSTQGTGVVLSLLLTCRYSFSLSSLSVDAGFLSLSLSLASAWFPTKSVFPLG